jgi:hypothetical protein
MPRTFFTMHIGEDVLPDFEGQDLRDADQAWEGAKVRARNLMNTAFEQPINWAAAHIEVKDDLDEIVLELPFLDAIPFTRQSHWGLRRGGAGALRDRPILERDLGLLLHREPSRPMRVVAQAEQSSKVQKDHSPELS